MALIAPGFRGATMLLPHSRHRRRGAPWPLVCRGLRRCLSRARPRGSRLETTDGTGVSALPRGNAGGFRCTVSRHQRDDFRDGDACHHGRRICLGRDKIILDARAPNETAILGLLAAASRIVSDRVRDPACLGASHGAEPGRGLQYACGSTLALLFSATEVSWELLRQMANRPS